MRSLKRTANILAFLCVGLLFLVVPNDSFASASRKRILILFPYESQTPGFIQFESRLRSTLTDSKAYEFEFYVESMDLTRFPSKRYHDRLMELYREKYSKLKLDLIVACQLSSLELLVEYRPESFLDVPVILYSQDSRLVGKPGPMLDAIPVMGRLDMKATLALSMRLHPDTRNLFVVTGASQFDGLLERIAREEFRDFENRIEVQYLSGLPMDDLIRRVSSLPAHSLLFYVAILRDGAGTSYKSPEALALISKQANAPIYSVSETYLGSGIVGGHLIKHDAEGAMVARVALRVLAGEDLDDLESSQGSGNQYMFDARELKRWGISENNLPPGSEVRYKGFSLWETYRWRIIAILSLLVIQAFLIFTLAVSRRKQRKAERAIQRAADDWQTTFDSTTDLIMLLDNDFRIVRANAAVASFTGLPMDKILDEHCCSLIHGSSVLPDDCPCTRVLKTKAHEDAVLYEKERDVWLFVSVDPTLNEKKEITGFVHTVRDVTERKRAVEAIEASEEFNRAVLASLKSQVAILDKHGKIIAVNQSWEQLAGQNFSPFIAGLGPGDNYLEVFRRAIQEPADSAGQALSAILSVMNDRKDTYSLEYLCDSRSGPRWFFMTVAPFRNSGGGVVISHTDITERKNAEQESQLRREELTHVTRIVTIGELASSLAHEINQPMTAILCNAEAAQRFLSGPEPDLAEVRTILDDIIQDDKRAGEVIRRIRTLVKKEAPLREAVALNDIIPETIALVRNASFLGGISIVTELDSELPSVQGDRVQLQQVILNLLLNATAAMKDTPAGLRKLIITTAVQDGQTVKVSVRDRGSGIDKNFMNRIFEPFYTTKADGLGMGLSISRTIIKAHGGTIWAENNGEGGATFYVTLPLYQGEQS